MSYLRHRYRGPKATKRLPTADLRKLLKDHRVWAKLARVYKPDDGDHYELVYDDAGETLEEILIEVETVPDRVPLTCRLTTIAGGANRGIWTIPSVGDDVLVALPDGLLDWMPVIVALLPSGEIPNFSGGGPAVDRTIIVNGEVHVHDGSGSTDALTKNEEFKNHVHPTGVGPSGKPTDPIAGVGAITGTTVLKAK